MNLKQGIVALFKKVSTSMPPDVEEAVREALGHETQEENRAWLERILETATRSRSAKIPLCIGTGVPVFFVSVPMGVSHAQVRETIIEATREATGKIPLSPSAVDVLSNTNSGDNTGEGFPVVHIEETPESKLTVELMLLGAGSEALGRTYSLPDEALGAERNFDGVRAVIADAVKLSGGRACPPYIIGVGIAATRDRATWLSKQQIRRKVSDTNPSEDLDSIEKQLQEEINSAHGRTLVLGVKIGAHHRHPDTYFVDVSFLCWNTRRGKLIW
ncbi:MAG: fumarate hydratase [Thermodesulfovibrionales bacterium]|nr:fumarate hydratase [Thermodesulfovibrionales bacterium]